MNGIPRRCGAVALRRYWQAFGLSGEVIEALEGVLYHFGALAAAMATDVALLVQAEQECGSVSDDACTEEGAA